MRNFLSKFFFGLSIGFLLISLFLIYQRYNPNRLAFDNIPQSTTPKSAQSPQIISLPKINRSLPITAVEIQNNHWPTSNSSISFVKSSGTPGDTGNSIFYGHNFKSLLGDLSKLDLKDQIQVTMDNGEKRVFTVTGIHTVSPNDSSLLSATEEKTITIYTCIGLLDSKRLVVTATYNGSIL